MPIKQERLYKFLVYSLLLGILAAMAIHQSMIGATKIPKDAEGNEIGEYSDFERKKLAT